MGLFREKFSGNEMAFGIIPIFGDLSSKSFLPCLGIGVLSFMAQGTTTGVRLNLRPAVQSHMEARHWVLGTELGFLSAQGMCV